MKRREGEGREEREVREKRELYGIVRLVPGRSLATYRRDCSLVGQARLSDT